ncbi:MAG: trimethylamine methyltransferase [Candidatus Eisenbacteria bacterium]|nr:trimethylamine methyltransferase [Candidatus Eisenbacteria bacterium]
MHSSARRDPEVRPEERPARAVRFPYRPLTEEDIGKIHDATMHVLSEVGFEIQEPNILELFRKLDTDVDTQSRVVRIRERDVMNLIDSVPSRVTLYGRRPGADLELGSGRVYCGTGGVALNVLDYETGQRRPAQLQDLIDVIRIVDRLENVDFMLLPTYPNEIDVDEVDVNRFFAGLCHTSKHVMGGVFTARGLQDVIAMGERVAGSAEALRERPFLSVITCGISPLRLDAKYGAFLMHAARKGIPVAVPAEPLCGATAPITLAGTLVIQNCDALIHMMAAQLVNPGTPVIYGCVATAPDMRDMKYLGGPVESGLLNAGAAQLAQHYAVPYYATAGISDSKTLDAQSGYESAINNLLVALAGGDFIHDAAGLMEFALTVSNEKLVIDNEIIGMAQRALRGIRVDERTLAVDAVKTAGPGGNFVAARHTRRFMRREHYSPLLSDREPREKWAAAGSRTAARRAHERVREILGEPGRLHIPAGAAGNLLEEFPDISRAHYQELVKP